MKPCVIKRYENKLKNIISFHVLQTNPALRCIVLKAEGPAFSAGHNLKEMTHKEGRAFHEEIFQKCNTLMYSIVQSPVPIIAQVDGIAAAAGCQLVSICDIAVATEKSKFLGWGLFQYNTYMVWVYNYWCWAFHPMKPNSK